MHAAMKYPTKCDCGGDFDITEEGLVCDRCGEEIESYDTDMSDLKFGPDIECEDS